MNESRPPDGAATDPRVARTKAAVLAAGCDLFEEKSVRGITVEEIARRTGIAKTTIYRHWPTRNDLLVAIIAAAAGTTGPSATDDPIEDIRANLLATWKHLTDPVQRAGLAHMIEMGAADPDLDQRHLAFVMERSSGLLDAVERAVAAGVLDADTDVVLTMELLGGPVLIRALVLAQPVDATHIDLLMAEVLNTPKRSADARSRLPGDPRPQGHS